MCRTYLLVLSHNRGNGGAGDSGVIQVPAPPDPIAVSLIKTPNPKLQVGASATGVWMGSECSKEWKSVIQYKSSAFAIFAILPVQWVNAEPSSPVFSSLAHHACWVHLLMFTVIGMPHFNSVACSLNLATLCRHTQTQNKSSLQSEHNCCCLKCLEVNSNRSHYSTGQQQKHSLCCLLNNASNNLTSRKHTGMRSTSFNAAIYMLPAIQIRDFNSYKLNFDRLCSLPSKWFF